MEKESSIFFKNDSAKKCKTIDLTCVQDTNLSWRAKGIHNYFTTQPDSWKVNVKELKKSSSDSVSGLRSGIKELLDMGYFFKIVKRNEARQIKERGFFISEIPMPLYAVERSLKNSGWELYFKK